MPVAKITKVDTEIQNKWTLYKKKIRPRLFQGYFYQTVMIKSS